LNKEKDIKIMINIECYMDDGANWQAQCVLAYLRCMGYAKVENLTWDKEKRRSEGELRVGRCENCREQGYVFTITYGVKQLAHFWVYEHRNCDDLCVVEFEGFYLNTPTINNIPMKDKYDTTKRFPCGDIVDCGEWLIERFEYYINREKSMTIKKNEGEE
jgi:predicted RNA-binding Zn-ribbon protein involved in translation (DUF1610 family)